jgi:hypothetical protein
MLASALRAVLLAIFAVAEVVLLLMVERVATMPSIST